MKVTKSYKQQMMKQIRAMIGVADTYSQAHTVANKRACNAEWANVLELWNGLNPEYREWLEDHKWINYGSDATARDYDLDHGLAVAWELLLAVVRDLENFDAGHGSDHHLKYSLTKSKQFLNII